MEEPARQSIIDLRVHEPGVGVEFRGKLPIGSERNGVLGAATSGERGCCAIGDAKAVLKIVIVTPHHIQFVGDGIFSSSPKYLLDPVMSHESSVVDVCVV